MLQQITSPPQNLAEVAVNENFETVGVASVFGKRHPGTAGLTCGFYGGRFNGVDVADGAVTLANGTNYVVAKRDTGAVSASTATTNWTDPGYARLHLIVAASGVVTSWKDCRLDTNGLLAGGSGTSVSIDTDQTLAANSDTLVASQKATKSYVDGILALSDALVYKGVIDCSGNPNYPAASAGHVYYVSVAGKIGGASGLSVEVGDMLVCRVDSTASGTQAAVGSSWNVLQTNLVNALTTAGGTLLGALNKAAAVSVASAATTNIGAAASENVTVTGTTTITAFDTIPDGARRLVTFAGALTLTHNATSLILPTAANIVTAAGDVGEFLSLGSGNWRCVRYQRANGMALAAAAATAPGATSVGVNAQTGTSYTVVTGDAGKDVTYSNAAAVAVTLPQAGSAGFAAGWSSIHKCLGNGVVTITPVTSTIEGATTLVLRRGDWAIITSDGTNYEALVVRRASRGVVALTDSLSSMTLDASLADDFRLLTTTGVGVTRAIPNPTNLVDGQKLNIRVKLGAASHAWTYGSKWKLLGSAITRSTASGSIIFISGQYDATDDTIVYAEANSA